MKKFLLTATMLVGFVAIAQAQQGRVGINTTTPAATLDVVGAPADATKADALLVPRLTRGQLQAKDAVYTTTQNGALAFVSSIADGAATGKAINVTAVGFYYYDGATTNTWIAVGGGGSATVTPTYRSTPGATTINILPSDVGNIVLITAGPSGNIVLPTPAASMVGKKLTIIEIGGIAQALTGNSTYKTNTLSALQQYGSEFITDGTNWYALGGQ
ncbi:hypothetical protein [Chryseobacterium gambrini]|uniref:Uncharacterized protein n=1 Tax=Chryseobacterium gambrini TaxID=373672 RepID=A0ABN7CFX8_9FLAO|nr:hypothetical protein CRDW_15080 [Chryseobacterium gambrini]